MGALQKLYFWLATLVLLMRCNVMHKVEVELKVAENGVLVNKYGQEKIPLMMNC